MSADILSRVCRAISEQGTAAGQAIIAEEYPFNPNWVSPSLTLPDVF
jgi:hypothetical protein